MTTAPRATLKVKLMQYALDTLPPLTDAQKADLERLAALPDEEIDYGDIPELTDAQLAAMRRPEHFRPVKKQITARVDADVLAWLKCRGAGLPVAHERDPAPGDAEREVSLRPAPRARGGRTDARHRRLGGGGRPAARVGGCPRRAPPLGDEPDRPR